HIVFLLWAAFVIPVGWAGLCAMLAVGPSRWIAGCLLTILLLFGAASTIKSFRDDLRGAGPEATMSDAEELREACHGQMVGYFAPEDTGRWERVWGVPKEGSWAVLADCKMMRLNKLKMDDEDGWYKAFWKLGSGALYARKQGREWQNDPATILGFAREHGIQVVAESPVLPIPPYIRPHLERWQSAGPFTLYRISPSPREPEQK